MPPPEARSLFQALRSLGAKEPVARVESTILDGVPCRIYRPSLERPLPALLFFHGGGWVLGSLETVDGFCRRLAKLSECVVISVDYRLSPEHKFPLPLDDCYRATAEVARLSSELGVDAGRIAVGGDSAGGNLAAAVCLRARDEAGPAIAFQLLIYPITDASFETPSYLENAEGFGLSRETMIWYWDQYLASPADAASPLASPLRASDLSGLPPALVVTAEYDVLRDEGEAYAARLLEAGVSSVLKRYDGMIHGFLPMAETFATARLATAEVAAGLRDALFR
jgi:acetyl esterase